MEGIEILSGAGTGGVIAALAYKALALLEQSLKRRNGGTDHDALVSCVNSLVEISTANGEELRNIKGLLYEVRAKQEQRDAIERDRAMRVVQ